MGTGGLMRRLRRPLALSLLVLVAYVVALGLLAALALLVIPAVAMTAVLGLALVAVFAVLRIWRW